MAKAAVAQAADANSASVPPVPNCQCADIVVSIDMILDAGQSCDVGRNRLQACRPKPRQSALAFKGLEIVRYCLVVLPM